MARFVSIQHFPLFKSLFIGGSLVAMLGCGAFSSRSDFEKFQDSQKAFQKGFSSTISGLGGGAQIEEQSMLGFKASGWKINLSGCKVTDAIIDKMIVASRGAPVLDLNLSGTKVTDGQLAKLDKAGVLAKTINLDLSNTEISDSGLDEIKAAVGLTNLNLEKSHATKDGADRLGKRKIANPSTPAPFKIQPTVKI